MQVFEKISLFYKAHRFIILLCFMINFEHLNLIVQVFAQIALFYKGPHFIINFADPDVEFDIDEYAIFLQ